MKIRIVLVALSFAVIPFLDGADEASLGDRLAKAYNASTREDNQPFADFLDKHDLLKGFEVSFPGEPVAKLARGIIPVIGRMHFIGEQDVHGAFTTHWFTITEDEHHLALAMAVIMETVGEKPVIRHITTQRLTGPGVFNSRTALHQLFTDGAPPDGVELPGEYQSTLAVLEAVRSEQAYAELRQFVVDSRGGEEPEGLDKWVEAVQKNFYDAMKPPGQLKVLSHLYVPDAVLIMNVYQPDKGVRGGIWSVRWLRMGDGWHLAHIDISSVPIVLDL